MKQTISHEQAKNFLIHYQGFFSHVQENICEAVLSYIRKVGCIQFDPLDVTGKNADLVLQARIKGYSPSILESLLYEQRKLLDGWDKMMSIYTVEDWPCFKRKRDEAFRNFKSSDRGKPVYAVSDKILRHISSKGPSCSSDIDMGVSTDWYWAPTSMSRAALEGLFHSGKLVIHSRKNNRKYYDLPENCIPSKLISGKALLKDEDYHDWYVMRRLGNWGIFWNRPGDGWLGAVNTAVRNDSVKRLYRKKKIVFISIKGLGHDFYMRNSDLALLENFLGSGSGKKTSEFHEMRFIAPLDNFIWDRTFIEKIFRFSYRWEVYKPEKERGYGYYVLPVIFGSDFVARFEPRREKKTGTLYVKNWWWEEGWSQKKIGRSAIENALREFADFLGCRSISIDPDIIKSSVLKISL